MLDVDRSGTGVHILLLGIDDLGCGYFGVAWQAWQCREPYLLPEEAI